jgi:hypothetical protein
MSDATKQVSGDKSGDGSAKPGNIPPGDFVGSLWEWWTHKPEPESTPSVQKLTDGLSPETRTQQEAREMAQKEFPNEPEYAELAYKENLFTKFGYGHRPTTDDVLKLARKRTEIQANTEFPDDSYVAGLRAKEIMYGWYHEGSRLEPAEEDVLIVKRASMQAEAEFRNYTGADHVQVALLAEREQLSMHGFKELGLTGTEKATLGKAREIMKASLDVPALRLGTSLDIHGNYTMKPETPTDPTKGIAHRRTQKK